MSLQHLLADSAIHAEPRTSFCRECSQPMRMAMAPSGRNEDEARVHENDCGHQEAINLSRQPVEPKKLQPSVQDAMLAAVPSLRAFAMSLSGKFDRADDLVQTTLLRAIANIHSFTPGTNMSAWLFTILRNQFRSEYRKRRREVQDVDGGYLAALKSAPEQYSRLEFKELFAALAKLPLEQREALLLVGASGFSYDAAAGICGIAVGTIKSRVNRARKLLAELLELDSADKFGSNPHAPKREPVG
jgi:RNA polymerase sigma-70 factor, ECF subfamily